MCIKGIFSAILLMTVSVSCTWAQNSPGLVTVIPPSPNASALGKYGEIPVSEYTGIPNISIPLYTLKSRDLEMPIALNYHAGGIRVEEIASWVGIGWSLNAGGVITRITRGMPDDESGGYFTTRGNSALAKKYLIRGTTANSLQISAGNADDSDIQYLEYYRQGMEDAEPDIFYFNFGKYSGQFFMNESGQFVVSPLSALKVEYTLSSANSGRLSRWILTTPDGVRYVFGHTLDGTRTAFEKNTNGTPWPFSTTGWYLVEVYSPSGDVLTLNYTNVSYSYTDRSSEVLNVLLVQQGSVSSPFPAKDNRLVLNNMSVPRLTSISGAGGTVVFDAGADRTDLPGEKSLGGVSIYGAKDASTALTKWKLFYSYSTNRLTLDSVSEYSNSGQASGKAYQFYYNGLLPNAVPSGIDINSQDLWGYYNGVTNTVLPRGVSIQAVDNAMPGGGSVVTVSGADRHSDENFMKAGSLSKIIYPTGGYSTFDYEANTVYTTADNLAIPQPGVGEGAGVNIGINDTEDTVFTILYPDPATNTVHATGTMHAMLNTCPFDNDGFSQCYEAQIMGVNGTSFGPYDLKEGSFNYELRPGTYKLHLKGEGLSGQSSNRFYLYMNWTEYPPASGGSPLKPYNVQIGGLRIKRITNYDGIGTSVTRYLYNLFSDTISSGVMVNQPSVYSSIYRYYANGGSGGTANFADYLQIKSFPLIPLMPTQGSSIGYQNVTKLYGENGENGKEEYIFTTATDFPDEYVDHRPYASPCSFDWRRGLLLHSTTYKNSSGNFTPVEMKAYRYSNGIKQTVGYGLAIDVDVALGSGSAFVGVQGADYYVGAYRTVSEQQYLQSDTTWIYDQNNPSSFLQNVNVYTYDTTLGHYQLLSKQTTNSKQQIEEWDYQHPQDISLTGYEETARQQMISNFMLDPVLDAKFSRNGLRVRETRNNYKVFGNNLVLPESLEIQVGDNPSEKRVEFLRYNNYGEVAQQHKVGDVLNTHIWDYNQTYPIASVINADSGNIAYTSFEADGSGNWTISDTSRNRAHFITGSQSFDLSAGKTISAAVASGQPYIVSYWSMNGGVSVQANGSAIASSVTGPTRRGWTYYEHLLPSTTSTVGISASNVTIDELRLFPSSAQMTTYTYMPLQGVTTSCNPNGVMEYFEYDQFNRLLRIRDVDSNILKQYDYKYQVAGRYLNIAKSGLFTRSNCDPGGVPSSVTYTVNAGTYSSAVSQAVADSLAQADVDGNGQTFANTNASCTFYNIAKSQNFTRNDCATGGIPSTVTYLVPAGKYSSILNQADADNKASADISNNGQTYANTIGSCTFYNTAVGFNFTKSNCTGCQMGSTVTYTIPAGKYSSTASQNKADSLASNDLFSNGQHYADSVGTCSTPQTGTVTGINSLAITVQATFTNLCTNTVYNFFLSSSSNGTIGSLPQGAYNVVIQGSGTHTYIVNGFSQTTNIASFYNITVTPTNMVRAMD